MCKSYVQSRNRVSTSQNILLQLTKKANARKHLQSADLLLRNVFLLHPEYDSNLSPKD